MAQLPEPQSELPAGNIKVTRDDWLRCARGRLIQSGIGDVKVLSLSAELGVSRSSFYWYFKSRQDLCEALLADWERTNTAALCHHAALPADTVTEAVSNLFRCFVNPAFFDHQLDFAVREWSRRDTSVRETIDRSDSERLDAITAMFIRYGTGVRPQGDTAMSDRYSAWRLFREGLRGHTGWQPAWRKATPAAEYDAIVIGGGGHGLATAYYLAKNHGFTRVALLEKNWIGGGNTGRNTTAVRSNYFYPESVALYDLSLRLYEGLSDELNYNVMLSQRGMLIAAHTPMQMEICTRIVNAMKLNGVDGELMTATQALEKLPLLNQTSDRRYTCQGGIWQGRAGVARHDARLARYAQIASASQLQVRPLPSHAWRA